MVCIGPREPAERQLWGYLEGGRDEGLQEHLGGCQHCRERLARLALWERRMKAALRRAECPDAFTLGEYQLGLAPASEAIRQHVARCGLCQHELATLTAFLAAEESAAPEPASLGERARSLVAEVVARLVPRAPSLAVRGEVREQITAEAEGMMVILDVRPGRLDRLSVFGQVSALDQDRWAEAVVQFRRGGQLEAIAAVDDLGTFRCETLLPGPFDLRITPLEGPAVVVPGVELTL